MPEHHKTPLEHEQRTADEGDARVRAAYGGALYERLAAIKRRYDADNILRGNLNVPPTAAT
ncbi:MAG TPA: BBE domain-containing protein [Candidatus Tectomicrobia bacterium]